MNTMRTTLAVLVLAALAACDRPPASTPSSTPAEPAKPAEPAVAATPEKPAPAGPDDEAAGFADPKTPAAEQPPPAPAQVPDDPALAARIVERFGERCKLERTCGDLIGVDCQSAVDGPYYYATRADLKTLATCGGACRGRPCTDCPPKAWTCPAR